MSARMRKFLRALAVALCLLLPVVGHAQSTAPRVDNFTSQGFLMQGQDLTGVSVWLNGTQTTFGGTMPLAGVSSPAASLGQLAGTSDLPITSVRSNLQGWDGSLQFRVGTTQGATDYWSAQGGIASLGPVLKCVSETDTAVPCNFYASGPADYWFSNGFGTQLRIANSGAMTVNYPKVSGGASGSPVVFGADGADAAAGVALVPKPGGTISSYVPPASTPLGTNAIDLQPINAQGAASQAATGPFSMIIGGGGSTASATRSAAIACQGCFMNGQDSSSFGSLNVSAFGRKNVQVLGHSFFYTTGDAQTGRFDLVGKSTGGNPVRLTTDGGTAVLGGLNCFFVPPNTSHGLDVMITAHDYTAQTTAAHSGVWKGVLAVDRIGSGNTNITTPSVTAALGAAFTVSFTSDATLTGCVNLTVTPAAATGTDEVHFIALVNSGEID